MRLNDFSVLSFDCYGTIVDWETGILHALQPLIQRASRSDIPEDDVLALFAQGESVLEAHHGTLPYRDLLKRVYDAMALEWDVSPSPEEREHFGSSVKDWSPFADSVPTLAYLKPRYKLVILSNVDRQSFFETQKRLGIAFDFVFTAENIGSYKPNVRNFEYMLERLREQGIAKTQVLHVAQSLFHDHVPANKIGLPSAWINRRSERNGAGATPMPAVMPRFDFEFPTLGALAEAHRQEQGFSPD